MKIVIASLVALSLVACNTSVESHRSSAERTFKLGVTAGAQDFLDFVMDRHGILKTFGLKAERVRSLTPAALHLLLAEREVDIGFAGFTTMATARSQGKDSLVVYGVLSPVNMVFVHNDSPIHTLADIRGKKLGIFGGPGSTTFAFLAVIAKKWYGIDLFNDVELISASAPALLQGMSTHEIDAVLLGTIESIQVHSKGTFRVLLDLSDEYKKRQGGRAPAHLTIATNEQFAGVHPDIVKDYIKAFIATVRYALDTPSVWDEYADHIGIVDDQQRVLLREKMGPNIVVTWYQEQRRLQQDYLHLVRAIIGPTVLATVPQDLISDRYIP